MGINSDNVCSNDNGSSNYCHCMFTCQEIDPAACTRRKSGSDVIRVQNGDRSHQLPVPPLPEFLLSYDTDTDT